MTFKDETSRDLAIKGGVLDHIYKLKVKHILPVRINPGKEIDNLQTVTLVYDREDTLLINWLIDKACNMHMEDEEL